MTTSQAPWQDGKATRLKMGRRLIGWGFVTALIILVFCGWDSYRNTMRFAQAAERQKHTDDVLRALDGTVARLVDAETGQRGYLLTGNVAYLEPYRKAIKSLGQETRDLKDLASDNPNEQKRIQAMEPLIEKKLAELQTTIELRRKGEIGAATRIVLQGSGKHLMDQIRALAADMASEENHLLRVRTQRANESMAASAHTIVAGSLVSILLLVLCFGLLNRELSERKRAQETLGKNEKWFSTTLGSIGDAVIATDMNGAVTFMNAVAQSLTGWSLEEARGKSMDLVFDIANKETRQPVENPVKKVLREGKVVGLADHTLLLSKDGKEFDIEDSAAPIVTGTGEDLGVVLVFRDITKQRQVHAMLQKSEMQLAGVVNSAMDAILSVDEDQRITLFNPAAEKLFGWSATEIMGQTMDRLIPGRFQAVHGKHVHSFANSGVTARATRPMGLSSFVACRASGEEFPIETTISQFEVGGRRSFTVIVRDITERKRAEDLLRQSREQYHLLFDSIPHPVWVYDLKTLAILDVNHSAVRNYGYSREEFLSQTLKDIRPAEDIPALLENVASLRSSTESGGVWKHRRKDGTLIDVEITSQALIYRGGDARLVVATNITERKQAEEALKASEQRLNLALDAAQLGIWELDLVSDKAYRNLRHDQIFGYESLQPDWGQEIFLTHVVPEDREIVKRSFDKAFATGDFHMECRIVWPDKSIHWISAQGRVFRNDKGDPVKMMGTVADVSERRRAQEAILHAKEDAERTSKFKDQFLSTMSHELRTPLNAVLGFSDLLSEERYGPLNERQQRYVAHIHTGGKHLLRLINDILDLSRIEAGHLQLAIESVPITTSLAEVLDALRPLADKKSQSLVQHAAPDLSVRADATRFKQIVMNLLGNAIKFTPEGGKIELAAQQLGEFVRVEVRDSGPGIPPGEQQRIFDAFYRLRQPDKAPEGTGLGLAITRRLVELHGGQLGLESQSGSGSCFYFTLPMAPTFQEERIRKTETTLDKSGSGRILVIEDDSASARLIESQLASSGYDVVLWDRQRHAVEMAADLQPDAITLDIVMKPVNGWELLSNLKSHPRTATIPVIVVSIVDRPATGALLGADEYIVKPVAKEVLLAAVKHCLKHRGHREQVRPILVVDDDNATREFIAELLSKHGYVVSTAADGAEARAQVAASLPELVILDLILPEVSGFQLLADWRADSRTTDLPIFVLTSKDLTPEEKDYLLTNAGALFHKQERWQEALIRQLQRAVPPAHTGKS